MQGHLFETLLSVLLHRCPTVELLGKPFPLPSTVSSVSGDGLHLWETQRRDTARENEAPVPGPSLSTRAVVQSDISCLGSICPQGRTARNLLALPSRLPPEESEELRRTGNRVRAAEAACSWPAPHTASPWFRCFPSAVRPPLLWGPWGCRRVRNQPGLRSSVFLRETRAQTGKCRAHSDRLDAEGSWGWHLRWLPRAAGT